jgi:hypothetical protein
MRLIPLLLVFSLNVHSQDCDILDKFNSFHGIKFGSKFPDSLKTYFIKDTINNTFRYSLWKMMTSIKSYEKFKNWFEMGYEFNTVDFVCLKDDRVYQVILRQEFEFDKPSPISVKKYPPFFNKIVEELKYTFGNPTISDDVVKQQGHDPTYGFYWECNNMRMATFISCAFKKGECLIMISDIELTKKAALQRYTD